MAHFLIVEDEKFIAQEWWNRLKQENHSGVIALNVDQALDEIERSEKTDGEPFDLILLDHNLGDEEGFDLIKAFPSDYWQHRIIIITGIGSNHLAKEYAKYGAIAHLIKPVSEVQFQTAISAALERRALYVEKQEDWESAYQLLSESGLLESLDQLRADSTKITAEYENLKAIYESLISELNSSQGKELEIAKAYEKAREAINGTSGSFTSMLLFLEKFHITDSFWSDVKDIYYGDKLQFFVLQSYLKRIGENIQNYHSKFLVGTQGHFEYRIGRNYRLYFRREGKDIVLERFGHKNIQGKIITFLINNSENIADKQYLK